MEFNQVSKDFKDIKRPHYISDWEPFMKKYNCEYVCELGVDQGKNFLEMIKHGPKLAVAIDSWIEDGTISRNDGHYTQKQLDQLYENFKNAVKDMPFVQIERDYTFNAVKNYEDNYFDFVYIDADHSTDACYKDIVDWYPKVKPGKFLVGHDYRSRFGVVAAVNRFVEENNLELIRFGHSNWAIIKKSEDQNNQVIKDLNDIRKIKKHYIWEPFMKKYNCEYVCELGVCKGKNFLEMIKHRPKLAVAVDSWIEDGTISRNDGRYSQEELDQQYKNFKTDVQNKPFVKIYKEYTFDAVKHFEDEYFDLVYIDADHTYEGCLQDMENWYPKVKKGRFLLGDDYRIYQGRRPGISFGVIEAVNEFAKKNNLDLILLPNYGWALIKK